MELACGLYIHKNALLEDVSIAIFPYAFDDSVIVSHDQDIGQIRAWNGVEELFTPSPRPSPASQGEGGYHVLSTRKSHLTFLDESKGD